MLHGDPPEGGQDTGTGSKYTIMNKLRISIYTSMNPFSETQTLSACAATF